MYYKLISYVISLLSTIFYMGQRFAEKNIKTHLTMGATIKYLDVVMKSNKSGSTNGRAAIEALRDLGFTIDQIRPIIPKLTGISLTRIADQVGMSCPTVTRTLSGNYGHPLVIRKIARVLDIPVEVLFPDKLKQTSRQP